MKQQNTFLKMYQKDVALLFWRWGKQSTGELKGLSNWYGCLQQDK